MAKRPVKKGRIRDIRRHMISNDQTDVNKFQYEYQPYPKILKNEEGKTIKDDDGQSVKAYSREEELALCKQYGASLSKTDAPEGEESDGDETPAPVKKKKGR